jgi:uncharacterized Zn finger protein (UPF0148 family)
MRCPKCKTALIGRPKVGEKIFCPFCQRYAEVKEIRKFESGYRAVLFCGHAPLITTDC